MRDCTLMSRQSPTSAEDRVSALLPDWHAWLRIRHRSLATHHADLVQDAATGLVHWLAKRAGTEISDEDVRRVGFRILQRRVVDEFRAQVGEWARIGADSDIDAASEVPDTRPGSNPPQALQHSRLLRALVGVLSEMNAQDRALLVGEELGSSPTSDGPRSGAQREHLRRLRKRVREALIKKHGLDVQDWLEE